MLERPDGKHWDGVIYYDKVKDEGALIVFRAETENPKQRVRLRGVMPEAQYQVTSEEESTSVQNASGRDLMDAGLPLTLPEQFSSDCLFFKRIDAE